MILPIQVIILNNIKYVPIAADEHLIMRQEIFTGLAKHLKFYLGYPLEKGPTAFISLRSAVL